MNKENSAKLTQEIELNREMPASYFKFISLPFVIDINSDVTFKFYHLDADTYMCKFEQKYYAIPVTIYTKVRVVSK